VRVALTPPTLNSRCLHGEEYSGWSKRRSKGRIYPQHGNYAGGGTVEGEGVLGCESVGRGGGGKVGGGEGQTGEEIGQVIL
jgi:hypothetical protein